MGPAAAAPAPATPPKLIVVISVDQFSANLFARWRDRFSSGLRRLSQEGVVYANGFQSHAGTETCPGHSTLLTGKHPSKTGIPANEWYDPATDKSVYCIAAPENRLTPASNAQKVGPGALKATTLGDWAKAASPQNRVFAVAGKDRAAVTMAGHKPDGAFWYVHGAGYSTYVTPGEDPTGKLGPLEAFNTATAATWAKAPPLWTYTRSECRALEATFNSPDQNALTTGAPIKAWRAALPPEGWTAQTTIQQLGSRFVASPFYDELTIQAAGVLIDNYQLGRGAGLDILAVGLSATDGVGHRYGSGGPEMCEQMYRLDALLGVFLTKLEGLGVPVTVVLSADHGGLDLPERLQLESYPDAGRLHGPELVAELNAQLRAELKLGFDPLKLGGFDAGQIWLTGPDGVFARGQRARVLAAAKAALARRPDVVEVHTRDELLAAAPPPRGKPADELSLMERMQESTVPGVSGDLMVAYRPYQLAIGVLTAGHGTAYDYDRKVPIIFWSPGHKGGERPLPIETTDIAPSLANLVGLRPDSELDGRCLDLRALGGPACP